MDRPANKQPKYKNAWLACRIHTSFSDLMGAPARYGCEAAASVLIRKASPGSKSGKQLLPELVVLVPLYQIDSPMGACAGGEGRDLAFANTARRQKRIPFAHISYAVFCLKKKAQLCLVQAEKRG